MCTNKFAFEHLAIQKLSHEQPTTDEEEEEEEEERERED